MSSSNLPIPILQPFPEPGATYLLELWARISRQLAYAFIIPEFEPNGSRPPSPQQHSSPTLPHSEELFPQAPPTSPGSSHSWQSSSEKAFSRSQSAASPNTEHTQSSAADSEHPDSDHSDESANYIPNEYWRDGPDSPIFKAMFAALSWAKGCPHIDLNLEDFRTLAHSTAGVVEAFLSPHKNINRDPPQLRTFDLTPVYPPYLPWRVLVSGSNEMTECLYILWGQPSMRLAHSANLLSTQLTYTTADNLLPLYRFYITTIISTTYVYANALFRLAFNRTYNVIENPFNLEDADYTADVLSRDIFMFPDADLPATPTIPSDFDISWLELRVGERTVDALIGGIFEIWSPEEEDRDSTARPGELLRHIDLVVRDIGRYGYPTERRRRLKDEWFHRIFNYREWTKPTSEWTEEFCTKGKVLIGKFYRTGPRGFARNERNVLEQSKLHRLGPTFHLW